MGDVLALPRIVLGIPLGDCNCSRPDATNGVPVPPWAVGTRVAGHVYGSHPFSEATFAWRANPTGTGRSININMQDDMDGAPPSLGGTGTSNQAYLETPKSPWGMVPHLGTSQNWRPYVALLHSVSLVGGQDIRVTLVSWRDTGVIGEERLMGVITSADNTGVATWKSHEFATAVQVPIATNIRYFSLRFWFNANGLGDARRYGLDAFGLGWIPQFAVPLEFEDKYIAAEYRHAPVSRVSLLRPSSGGLVFPFGLNGGATSVEQFAMRFDLISQAWAEKLSFFWRASRGTPTKNDRIQVQEGGDLIGVHWPWLIRPLRPGVKELMYIYPLDESFPLEIDPRFQSVRTTSLFSGTMNFVEQLY